MSKNHLAGHQVPGRGPRGLLGRRWGWGPMGPPPTPSPHMAHQVGEERGPTRPRPTVVGFAAEAMGRGWAPLRHYPQMRCPPGQPMPGWQPGGNQPQCRLCIAPGVGARVGPGTWAWPPVAVGLPTGGVSVGAWPHTLWWCRGKWGGLCGALVSARLGGPLGVPNPPPPTARPPFAVV